MGKLIDVPTFCNLPQWQGAKPRTPTWIYIAMHTVEAYLAFFPIAWFSCTFTGFSSHRITSMTQFFSSVCVPGTCAMSWIAAIPGIIVNFETAIGHGTMLWPAP
jgi:hypothetical protein